jgi:glycosyltransferase involved in cell wall biosynthesis
MTCLFLAPLKSPDHPVPSGDRAIGRLFWKALAELGFKVELASTLRTRLPDPTDLACHALAEAAESEIATILDRHKSDAPEFVFCYHNYYKAPDLIGPSIARAFGCPYIVAEASLSPKRLDGPHARGERLAAAGIAQAALIFCPTARESEMIRRHSPAHQRVVDLKPFLDPDEWHVPARRTPATEGPFRLVTVAMMRHGAKMRSYALLAEALMQVLDLDWMLEIHGDGEARAEVEAAFSAMSSRVHFAGLARTRRELSDAFSNSELFVWPGVDEAFGMAYLEAQLHGLPCLAGRFGGISDVICDGETGHLVANCTAHDYAKELRRMIGDRHSVAESGSAARDFVLRERTLSGARSRMGKALEQVGIRLPQQSGQWR